jgi:hypothetical protein
MYLPTDFPIYWIANKPHFAPLKANGKNNKFALQRWKNIYFRKKIRLLHRSYLMAFCAGLESSILLLGIPLEIGESSVPESAYPTKDEVLVRIVKA